MTLRDPRVRASTLPKGSVRDAQVRSSWLNTCPEAVVRPWKPGPYHDALPRLILRPDFFDPAASPDGEALRQAARDAAAALAAMKRRREEGDPAVEIAKLARELNASQREAARMQGQVAQLQEKLKAAGKGTEKPACWADTRTGKIEYIFDVALTRSGMIVRDRKLPHRAEDQAELPIRIDFGRELSSGEFLSQTRQLYDWSVAKDCRFFVLVSDETGDAEKAAYKRQIRNVGQHFYLFEPVNARF